LCPNGHAGEQDNDKKQAAFFDKFHDIEI